MDLIKIAQRLEKQATLTAKIAEAEERRVIIQSLKNASNKTAFGAEIAEYKDVRVITDHQSFRMEELPAKGKRKLRVMSFYLMPYQHEFSLFNLPNIVDRAEISDFDSFELAVSKIEESLQYWKKRCKEEHPEAKSFYPLDVKTSIQEVNYLLIEPADVKPMSIQGKDFTVESKWTSFSAYDPQSDFQLSDPHYTQYAAKSAGAARKFYKILNANPDALKNVPWSQFGDWMRSNGIKYDTHFSVWH